MITIQRLVQYFTEYAFVYVGLYGESFIDSGKEVFKLFKVGFVVCSLAHLSLTSSSGPIVAESRLHHYPKRFHR